MVTSITERHLTWMLNHMSPSKAVTIAQQLLADHSKRALPANPSLEAAKDLISTLRTRQANMQQKQVVAYGLDDLISSLEKKRHQKIIGQAYSNDRFFGKFYFDENEGMLVGFTVIDQCQKQRQPPETQKCCA
jgi:hypothetical protein